MYKLKRSSGALPKMLKGVVFSSYDAARIAFRSYIRKTVPAHKRFGGSPCLGDYGFLVVKM